ncbi:uncharacterized protein SCHCODRAFT_02692601 [Schizophyllum commune H4-8]|uniref:uncharacterized protein n=1 Tax=Schizophyllum commune (strain H4-8 / FGSC 9210) TaxID=578458 RepID=UPI00215DE61A|nr:uncharacterized protein SCHCODRAFT_02692601 [Schizophyllum commune H4-8]KAI5888045.1 hypothetical protein SCHCODRAFT_02692601 [Schizophyllum commune H4-8]
MDGLGMCDEDQLHTDKAVANAQTPLLPGPRADRRRADDDRRSVRVHLFRYFFCAFALLVFFVHVLSDKVRYKTLHVLGLGSSDSTMNANECWPIPDDINVVDCREWEVRDGTPCVGKASFRFALPADELFALSRGPRSHGVVRIRQSADPTDDVRIEVEARSEVPAGLVHAKACLSRREGSDDTAGIGLFTDRWWDEHAHRHYRGVRFDVEIILPKHEDVLQIIKMSTDVPNFQQSVAGLADTVLFQELDLRSANGRINAESLRAVHGKVETRNGQIDGTFYGEEYMALHTTNGLVDATASANVTDIRTTNGAIQGRYAASRELSLWTSNGQISASVALENDPQGPPTKATLQNSNGRIQVDTTLISTEGSAGSFIVNAQTHNAALNLDFVSAPLDAALNLEAHTSNGGVDMGEGGGGDRGRRHIAIAQNTAKYVQGAVGWSEEGMIGRMHLFSVTVADRQKERVLAAAEQIWATMRRGSVTSFVRNHDEQCDHMHALCAPLFEVPCIALVYPNILRSIFPIMRNIFTTFTPTLRNLIIAALLFNLAAFIVSLVAIGNRTSIGGPIPTAINFIYHAVMLVWQYRLTRLATTSPTAPSSTRAQDLSASSTDLAPSAPGAPAHPAHPAPLSAYSAIPAVVVSFVIALWFTFDFSFGVFMCIANWFEWDWKDGPAPERVEAILYAAFSLGIAGSMWGVGGRGVHEKRMRAKEMRAQYALYQVERQRAMA